MYIYIYMHTHTHTYIFVLRFKSSYKIQMKQVTIDVVRTTGKKQRPWYHTCVQQHVVLVPLAPA